MSQQKPVVGESEAVTLLLTFLSYKVFLAYGVFIYSEGLNASWIIPLINTLLGLLGVLLLISLLSKFPGQDLVKIGEVLSGPYLNMLFVLFYLFIFLLSGGLVLRLAAERMAAGFFVDTPISLTTFFFIAGALVVSYLGLEAVARTARFLLGILIITAMAMVIFTIPFWQFHALYPLWGSGPWGLLKGAIKNSGDYVQILFLGVIYPFIPRDRLKAIGIKSVLFASFFMFLYILVPLLIFTYPSVTELAMPSIEMARIINLGRFGQRLEVIFLPVWVFSNLITLSIALYASAAVFARAFKLNDYRPFVLSSAVFILVIASLPENVSQAIYYHYKYLTQYSLSALALILLILHSVAWIRGKEESKG